MEATTEDVAAAPAPVNSLPPGTMLQEYRVGAVVGEGGFGIVYRALDTLLEREVAIKEYLPVSHAVRRGARVEARSATQAPLFAKGLRCFVGEAQMLARFKHPALVEVLRFWEESGTAYMVMPFYRGRTLREAAQRGSSLKSQQSLMQVLRPLLGGLATLHAAKCYHRDISVDNILLLDSGAPVLLDFGAARSMILAESDDATVILKPGFAPIEQYSGDQASAPQGPWTDIYALSAVLYQLVSDVMPAPSVARIIRDPVVPLSHGEFPGFSRAFLQAIDRGMAVRPEDRPQTIAAFERLLLALDEGEAERQVPARAEPAASATGAAVLPLRRPAGREGAPGTAGFPASSPSGGEAVGTPEAGMAGREGRDVAPDRGTETRSAETAPSVSGEDAGPGAAPEPRPAVLTGVGKGVWIGAALIAAACTLGAALYLVLGMNEAPIAASVATPRAVEQNAGAAAQHAANDVASAMTGPLRPPTDAIGEARPESDGAAAGEANGGEPVASGPAETGGGVSPAEPVDDAAPNAVSPGASPETAPPDRSAGGGASGDRPAEASGRNLADRGPQADGAATLADSSGSPAGAAPGAGDPGASGTPAAGDAARVEAPQAGSVQVTVRPWGRVYLNGELVGTVPPRLRLSVPVGANEIEIRNESHPPHVVQLRIKPGESVQVSHDFLRAAAAAEAPAEAQAAAGSRE